MSAAERRTVTPSQRPEARSWMQAARALLIERHPYLDIALSSMLLVETPGHGTVSVDSRWRLYYDPQRVMDLVSTHGIGALTSDWVHEVMHVLRDHHERWVSLQENPALFNVFNVAADAVVNTDVTDLGMDLGDGWITFASLPPEAGCRRQMTTEEIFRRLRDLRSPEDSAGSEDPPTLTQQQPQHANASANGAPPERDALGTHDCGSGAGGPPRAWEHPQDDDIDDGSPDTDRRVDIREETARKVDRAALSGNLPPGLRWWARDVITPVVDWKRELIAVVSRHLSSLAGRHDYSYVRTSRRRVPGFVLPGMVAAAPPAIAAVVDTSGSMGLADLTICLGELLGLIRAAGGQSVSVVLCDHDIIDVYKLRTPAQLASMPIRGGRGTDMPKGIDASLALRPLPDVIVVLTDGDTSWPPAPPAALKNGRVIALLTQTNSRASVPDWITTIVVDGPGSAVSGRAHRPARPTANLQG